ncbi:head-tail adaptor protein [Hymenobacter sp. APR13]|uniref:phage head completion protein n=1 Tax=Hymenobacter sp. APR13 TaxID=1356852 RepID=UPI0012DFF02D|nr:head-tail adaptor protein [Hymenobacter sp. APR13]
MIVVKEASFVDDGIGGVLATDTIALYTLPAQVTVLKAVEQFLNNQLNDKQPIRITIRYMEAITSDTPLEWQGKRVTVVSVVPSERKTELVIFGWV